MFPDLGAGSPTDNATNYFAALWNWTITPHIVAEGDIYLIAGNYHVAGDVVYALRAKLPPCNVPAPIVAIDVPMPGTTMGGQFSMCGWAYDSSVVSSGQVTVDGVVGGICSS